MQFRAIPIREPAEANLFHHVPYAINICVHHWSHAGARHATTTAQDRLAYRIQYKNALARICWCSVYPKPCPLWASAVRVSIAARLLTISFAG
jgi:hypothetical protein